MAKFEVELELTGLRLKIKGQRGEDVPHIAQQLGQQVAGLLEPAAAIVEPGSAPLFAAKPTSEATEIPDNVKKKKRKTRSSGQRRNGQNGTTPSSPSPDWQHNAANWGTPRQTWTAQQKILWVLYVMGKEVDQTEFGGPTIADVFNGKFKQFGPLKKNNMSRDLGALKTKTPHAYVMDNTSVSPFSWYLTEEGTREAERLIADAKSGGSPSE